MNYAKLDPTDSTNGIGFGVSLFVSGCRHHCKGCHNAQAWSFKYGEEFTDEVLDKILNLLSRSYVDFFSVLGGEPFEPENSSCVLNILNTIKDNYPNLTIFIWSGGLFEDLILNETNKLILEKCDYLIDGEYDENLRNLKLTLRGSSNQRIIDLKQSFVSNITVDVTAKFEQDCSL